MFAKNKKKNVVHVKNKCTLLSKRKANIPELKVASWMEIYNKNGN